MTWEYRGFSSVKATEEDSANHKVNNPADISVIVIYFVVVLGVGIWVSDLFFLLYSFFLTYIKQTKGKLND